ncbi:hypothetical protein CO641_11080 [Lysobacteraceae bacterium NML91-0213]|nr:hypothetical protein CO641_11080 [Xanthomonadaceae bacterium NML91-0213]
MDNNALIMAIGQAIVSDPKVAAEPWDGYALIASYSGDRRTLSGFRYRDGQPPQAATPGSRDLGEQFDALREATRVEGKAPWGACVIRIVGATGRISADFAYEAADLWHIGPGTLAEVSERARPG